MMAQSSPQAIDDPILARAAKLSSAALHEAAGKTGALPSVLKPCSSQVRVAGRAFPVRSPPGDNLWLHRAIYAAGTGDVLVADVGNSSEFGYWGEVMALAAQTRGIAGLVITGGVRDSVRMLEMGFPVFCACICIQGTGKDPHGDGRLGEPVTIGGVMIRTGDLVFGDADGVVVLPRERVERVVTAAEDRETAEQRIFAELRAGRSTIEIYNLPR